MENYSLNMNEDNAEKVRRRSHRLREKDHRRLYRREEISCGSEHVDDDELLVKRGRP